MHRGPPGKLEAAVTAFFKPDPEIAEGCAPEDYWEDPVEVWPENWDSLMLFISLQTQWNVSVGMGGGGRTGLRYEAVYPLLDRAAADDAEWTRIFAEIRRMEAAVLAIPPVR